MFARTLAAVVSAVVGLAVLSLPSSAVAAPADCSAGTTLLVSAHEDDDLLFMSPDLLHEIAAGRCVRTVYLTAGDSGEGETYWRGREAGEEAAYALMAGVDDSWVTSDAGLPGRSVPVMTLTGAPRVSLEFLRLPGASWQRGEGFPSNGFETLQKLWQKSIRTVHPLDGGPPYTKQGLVDTLAGTINRLHPERILTHDDLNGYGDFDHYDHTFTGYFTRAAQRHYRHPHEYLAFRGYSVNGSPENVSDQDLALKKSAFYEYAKHDPNVCGNDESCAAGSYAGFLARQYAASSPTGTVHPEELRGAGSVGQVVTVTADTTSSRVGTAVVWQSVGHVWQVVQPPFPVKLPAGGLAPRDAPGSLAGRTPMGAFRPASVLGFASAPVTTLPYRRLTGRDRWPYDARAPRTYNVVQRGHASGALWRTSRSFRFADHRERFPQALLMDYNLPQGIHWSARHHQREARKPASVARGSLLIHAGRTEAKLGWVVMPVANLHDLLSWMHPAGQRTTFFLGTPAYLRANL